MNDKLNEVKKSAIRKLLLAKLRMNRRIVLATLKHDGALFTLWRVPSGKELGFNYVFRCEPLIGD